MTAMDRAAVTRVKICCIGNRQEVSLAVSAGAAALGFVSEMPSGPGVIAEDLIADLVRRVPPPVAPFLLTSKQEVLAIAEQQRRTRVSTLQIVDRLPLDSYSVLRRELPGVRLVQVIHVTGPSAIDEAGAVAPLVDALLLDSGNPALPRKELGGTGRTHDWAISRRIREAVEVPVFLAGGLTPANVADAIHLVRPFAVDVCSGVRSDGQLDEDKLRRFFVEVHSVGRV